MLAASAAKAEVAEQREHDQYDDDDPEKIHHNPPFRRSLLHTTGLSDTVFRTAHGGERYCAPMVIRIGAALVVLAVVGILGFAVLRPPVEAVSAASPAVTVRCSAATGVSVDACRGWGDQLLAEGPPSHTFEMDDLARLVIDRSGFGLGSACEVSYFISRDLKNRVWQAEVVCKQG